jgi:hypothetical protein
MIIVFIIVLILISIFWKVNKNEYLFYHAPAVKPAPKNCSKPCPKIFKPVYDTEGKQYANSCLFEIAKCKNSKLQLGAPNNAPGKTAPGKTALGKTTPRKITQAAPLSVCDEKMFCKPSIQPQYDTDGQFYINDCFFEKAKCKNPSKERYDCGKHNCTNKSSTQVCDNYGKKYINICEYLKETCKGGRINLTTCPDIPVCEDIKSNDKTCKLLPDCAPTDMDKLLPEYCEMNSNDSQTCVYVNNGKACLTVISPKKFNNEEKKMKVSEIIKNAQPPELDIQIFPFTNT